MMENQKKFRAKLACKIAHIDQNRFNEAVSDGFYPCAPKVKKGAPRLFDETDIIALFIYGRLLSDNGAFDHYEMSPKMAGAHVCGIYSVLREKPDEEIIYMIRQHNGFKDYAAGSSLSGPPEIYSGSEVFYTMVFDIENARRIVRRAIKHFVENPDDD